MIRTAATIFLSFFCISVMGQVHHSCPLHHTSEQAFTNPLYDDWLSDYDIKYYNIDLSVSNKNTWISGVVAIGVQAVNDMDTIVFELQDALAVTDVFVKDGITDTNFTSRVQFDHNSNAVLIRLDRTRQAGEKFSIRMAYHGEAGQQRGFFAGITSSKDSDYGFDVTYTLSEPHNAKDWFPVKQVLEDKIDSVTVKLQCDKQLMAASNGVLVDIEEVDYSTHRFIWHSRYPIAYYLVSFAVADYRDFSFYAALSEAGDSVLIQNYIYDSDAVYDDWKAGILKTGSMLTLFSTLFMDYPFAAEKYGHAMAPMGGGMEHQTMTTIQDFGFSLVAHELAHQWFGDYITCGNWQDIWINEGFASYMEYIALQRLAGQKAADQWMAEAMSLALGETSGSVYVPANRVKDKYRLFDFGLTYKKGAILLHMIRYRIDNDIVFFKVLSTFLEQYGNGLATGEDFRETLETVSGMDFSCFFEQWYYGEGYPRFSVYWVQEGDSLKIQTEQTSTAASTPFFQTPFDLEIRLFDGSVMTLRLVQDQKNEVFQIAVEGVVEDVLFDPGNHILKSDHVIQQLPSGRKFVFGPNPVSEKLYIQFSNANQIDEIRLTSMSGQEIQRQVNAENPVVMNLSALKDGPYLLMLSENNNTYQERIVKITNQP